MFEYQEYNQYFAQITGGMEELGAEEIKGFGAKKIRTAYRGVYFQCNHEKLYRINYQSRMLTRVLAPLKTFNCHSTKYLYNQAKQIDWTGLFKLTDTFAITASVANSTINHSKYAAQCLKDSIVDQFRDKYNDRPNIDTKNPDVSINLRINKNKAIISWDTSGGSLHKRGYRTEMVDAPMKEYLAAAIVHLSGWNGKTPLYDPMCGSGTLLSEALLHYCRIPSGFKRQKFGFEFLPDFEPDTWNNLKDMLKTKIRELPEGLISGSDISKKIVGIAKAHQRNIPYGTNVKIIMKDFKLIENLENHTIICNPPYGIRLGTKESTKILYKELGDFLKQKCKGSTAYIYVGDRSLISSIGLKPTWKKPLISGDLDGRLLKIELY